MVPTISPKMTADKTCKKTQKSFNNLSMHKNDSNSSFPSLLSYHFSNIGLLIFFLKKQFFSPVYIAKTSKEKAAWKLLGTLLVHESCYL